MKRILKIVENDCFWDETTQFAFDGDVLEVVLDTSAEMVVGKYVLSVQSGGMCFSYPYSSDGIKIDLAKLLNGKDTCDLVFSLIKTDEKQARVLYGGYFIEPLKIVKINGNFGACGVLHEVLECIEKLEATVKELSEKIKEYETGGIELPMEIEK